MKHPLWTIGSAILLLAATSASAEPKAKQKLASGSPDAVRCVRQPVTGSIAQTKKVCMTNREWRQAQDDARSYQSLVCAGSECQGR